MKSESRQSSGNASLKIRGPHLHPVGTTPTHPNLVPKFFLKQCQANTIPKYQIIIYAMIFHLEKLKN